MSRRSVFGGFCRTDESINIVSDVHPVVPYLSRKGTYLHVRQPVLDLV